MASDWGRVRAAAAAELRHLLRFNPSDRRWQMPVAAALASGVPLLLGAGFGRLDQGLVAALGGLVFLYLPPTPLQHRMPVLMACAFGMAASYALGVLSHVYVPLLVPVVAFVAVVATMLCRFYGIGPPGAVFFVMAAAIGAYTPVESGQVPTRIGLFTLGALLAWLIAFGYSLVVLRRQPGRTAPPLPRPTFDAMILEPVVIGAFVALSLALAQLLQLSRPYWVPVSCIAVLQGASLRAVWNRQLQRIVGTALGLAVCSGLLLAVPLTPWTVAVQVIVLTLVIEAVVVRHYGLASVFITPLTILLAEAAALPATTPGLLQARFWDTVLGCLAGFAGGVCLHSPRLRAPVARLLRRFGR